MAPSRSTLPSEARAPAPCRCAAPNAECRRAGSAMVGRLWQLCAGSDVAAEVSAAYRFFWDGLPTPVAVSKACQYLGADTEARRLCDSCRGKVELKVFACQHPAHADRPTTTIAECRSCPEHTAC